MNCLRLFAGLPLWAFLCATSSTCWAQQAPAPAVNVVQLMDSVALRLQQHYIFPEQAQRMGAYVGFH